MAEFSKGYAAIGNVSIIGGSSEDGASNVVGADSAKALKSVFDSVSSATGLDLASIIQGQAVGRGIGEGVASATAPTTRKSTPTTRRRPHRRLPPRSSHHSQHSGCRGRFGRGIRRLRRPRTHCSRAFG
ncbi:hypothetical protein SAMN04489807_3445 [Microbacterium hydrocarbonoxydans]|uniref:Uncharacterized protein n=2 Tax=Microbacterium hydrocarbonoxydans TaxID=273678 RepID=A0A1H4T3U3_9MICO|nr:hypothetical protein SAMN04489807_3445 [Microbacterium hydrocarbonoxydans]